MYRDRSHPSTQLRLASSYSISFKVLRSYSDNGLFKAGLVVTEERIAQPDNLQNSKSKLRGISGCTARGCQNEDSCVHNLANVM